MSDGNFGFLKEMNPELYEILYFAEKKARTDFKSSGHETREAMEAIVGNIIDRNHLGQTIRKNEELAKKIEKLRDETVLREAGYLKAGERLEEKPLLPNLGVVSFKYANGANATEDYYQFLRKFGNTCSHSNKHASDVKLSYDSVIKCLKGYHQMLKKIYKKRISKNTPDFDENIMPIEEYRIYKSYVPNDKVRSKCEREFLAYIPDDEGERDFYAVLRLYRKTDISDYFLRRNHKCFSIASKMSISSVPEGMTKMRELVPIDSDKSTFYIISYIFNREPFELSDAILAEMPLTQRTRLCCKIADCMNNLHHSEVPIEHRMLNYESVFVCKFREEWIPYVIKFDFAKIESQTMKYTVLENAMKAKEVMEEMKLVKYLPPEWENMDNREKLNWAKVDIYSLGILFSDILYGKIEEMPVSLDELEELGVSDEVLALLDYMRAEDPDARLDIEEVKAIFDDALR